MRIPAQLRWLPELLRSAALARAFTLAVFGAVFSSHAVQWLAGQVTYVTIVVGLCIVGLGMLVARRRELSFLRLVPITLIVFTAWLGISVFWSRSPSQTVIAWMSFLAIAFLAIVVGHVRDTLQTARALGDVMRWLLSISLGLEIVIGILLPQPLHLLGIDGNIVDFGPIEGIFGSRNMLGFVAVLALITFVVEWRTASVRPGIAVYSVAVAGLLAALSRSPTVLVLAASVGVATGVLAIARRLQPNNRNTFQWGLAALLVVALGTAYLFRHQLIAAAGPDFSIRANLWRMMSIFVRFYPIQGFGWFGPWPTDEFPFISINYALDKTYTTGLNAYADLVLQIGWVGAFLFVAMVGVACLRAWLVAGERRSIVYAWTPLILVTLVVNSLFESFVLFGAGLLLLVVCLVRAGQSRSWRERIEAVERDDPGLPEE